MLVDRAAACEVVVELELGTGACGDNVEDFEGFRHDFWANVIARKDEDLVGLRHGGEVSFGKGKVALVGVRCSVQDSYRSKLHNVACDSQARSARLA